MGELSLSLLGSFSALLNGEPLKFRSNRGQALLIYLVTERVLGTDIHRRESLMELLWPGMPQKSAQVNLRQTLYQLRQAIPPLEMPEKTETCHFLQADRQTVGLDNCYPITSDIEAFISLLDGPEEQWPQALDLYRDDFLADFFLPDANSFEEWAAARRAAFRRQATDSLGRLAEMALHANDGQTAERYARRQLVIDNLRESAHRQLMQALALKGQRSQALAQYGEVKELFASELGAEPSTETETLYQQLLSGEPLFSFRPSEAITERIPRVVGPCPYRGLAAFREQDSPFFFGRLDLVQQLTEAVMHQSLIHVLVGSSGSGKSSAVYAGLLPQLRQNGNWLIANTRPGSQPYQATAAALLTLLETNLSEADRLIETQKLGRAMLQGDVTLESVAMRALEKNAEASRLLLLLDQFEELYTFCSDDGLRRRFLDDLLAAAENSTRQRTPPLVFLLTLRADFMGQALGHRPFADALQDASFMIGPMTTDELRQAIEKPAEKQGAAFEERLVERILKDVGKEPGHLPLLEFALTLLWERQDDGWLTHANYEEIGEVEGALARYADNVMEHLEEREKELARQIFIQLVRPGQGTEDTRRVAVRSDFADEHWSLIRHLADSRMVVTGRDESGDQETVEVVHEALIQRWGQLRQWMTADRIFRTWQERLRVGLQSWQISGSDEGALLRGGPLAEAEDWLAEKADQMSDAEKEYILASVALRERREMEQEAQRQRELVATQKLVETEKARATDQAQSARRSRKQAIWLAGALVIAVLLAVIALIFGRQAQTEANIRATAEALARQESTLASARELSMAAVNNLVDDPELSILLALESLAYTHTLEAENTLHWAIQTSRVRVRTQNHSTSVNQVAYHPGGITFATAGGDGVARVWDAVTGELVWELEGHEDFIQDLAYNPDGTILATAGNDLTARLWDLTSGKAILTLDHPEAVDDVGFSPDGEQLATASYDGGARIWDVASGELEQVLDVPGCINVVFSPDGDLLATTSLDTMAQIWDLRSGEKRHTLEGHTEWVLVAEFSPDGSQLATGGMDTGPLIWDVETGKLLQARRTGGVAVDVAYSPDGLQLAVAYTDGKVHVWNLATLMQNSGAEPAFQLAGHKSVVLGIAYGPYGRYLATGSLDGEARIWDISAPSETKTLIHENITEGAVFSPDGRFLAIGVYETGDVVIWDTEEGTPAMKLKRKPGDFWEVAFSPDGQRVAAGYFDGTVATWDLTEPDQVLFEHQSHFSGDVFASGARAVAYSPNGRLLASAGENGRAYLWDAQTGEKRMTITGHGPSLNPGLFQGIAAVAFSPDGNQLATAGADGVILLWDIARSYADEPSAMLLSAGQELFALVGHEASLTDVDFSPDGRSLASSDFEGRAIVWNLASRQPLFEILTSSSSIYDVDFSPDGRLLALACHDGLARIWDIETQQEWLKLYRAGDGGVCEVAFSPDGMQLVATGCRDRQARFYTLRIADLIALARSRLTRGFTTEECQSYLHMDGCPSGGD